MIINNIGRQILEPEIRVYFSEGFQCAEHESGHRIALTSGFWNILT